MLFRIISIFVFPGGIIVHFILIDLSLMGYAFLFTRVSLWCNAA